MLELGQQFILTLNSLNLGLALVGEGLLKVGQRLGSEDGRLEVVHEEVALEERVEVATVGNIEQSDRIVFFSQFDLASRGLMLVTFREQQLILPSFDALPRRQERSPALISIALRLRLGIVLLRRYFRCILLRHIQRVKYVHTSPLSLFVGLLDLLVSESHFSIELLGLWVQS
jgi:hypothetical protein